MQGIPELGQGAPAGDDTLSQLFGLQFDLNSTQREAARQVAAFNQKLNRNNTSNDDQVEAYKKRVAELEAEVARKDQENRELYEAQLELVRYQLEHLEQTSVCDEPMGYVEPVPRLDENGIPIVRIPQYRKVAIKEEIPREIRVLLDRKPTALKIQGLVRVKPHRASN
jgi:predicted RNase H-like nuclease (RuvC/YqgF family)